MIILDMKNYCLFTLDGCSKSNRTIDISFNDFSKNYDLQVALNLSSYVFIKPSSLLGRKASEKELIERVAHFISAFKKEESTRDEVYNCLIKNNMIRILIMDSELLEKVKTILKA